MPTRERLDHLGARRGRRLVAEFAEEVRAARLAAGLSQAAVGRALGISKSCISRLESGTGRVPDFVTAARVAQMVGLDLSIRCYRSGSRLRDAAHVQLVRRFLAVLPRSVPRRLEAPIPLERDQRAWDVLLTIDEVTVGVAAETRLRDIQALLRSEQAKQRDSGVDRLLLVVADTRTNRTALRDAGPALDAELPLPTRRVLSALRQGRDPGANGWVVI